MKRDKINCKCGSIVSYAGYAKHRRSKKHLEYLKVNNEEPDKITKNYKKADKINCKCGSNVLKNNISKHMKTNKHLRYTLRENEDYKHILNCEEFIKLNGTTTKLVSSQEILKFINTMKNKFKVSKGEIKDNTTDEEYFKLNDMIRNLKDELGLY